MAYKSNRKPQTHLFAANSTPITTYGTKQFNVSLHPRFSYPFEFVLADTPYCILGLDFLTTYNFVLDPKAKHLIDVPNHHQYTLDPVACDPVRIFILSPIDPVGDLLHQFPDLLQPISVVKPVKHSIVHHIHTTGPPVRARRYSPETMKILKTEIENLF